MMNANICNCLDKSISEEPKIASLDFLTVTNFDSINLACYLSGCQINNIVLLVATYLLTALTSCLASWLS